MLRFLTKLTLTGFFLLTLLGGKSYAGTTFAEDSTPRQQPEKGYTVKMNGGGNDLFTSTAANMTSIVNSMVSPSRAGSGPSRLFYNRYYHPATGFTAGQQTTFAQNLRTIRDSGTGVKVIMRPKFQNGDATIVQVRGFIDTLKTIFEGTCSGSACSNGGGSCANNGDCNYCDVIDKMELGFVGQFGEWHSGTNDSAHVCEAAPGTYDPNDPACASTCTVAGNTQCSNTPVAVSCSTNSDCVGADTRAIYDYAMSNLCATGVTTRQICFRSARFRFVNKYNRTAAQRLAEAYDGSNASRACFYDDGISTGLHDGFATLQCPEYPENINFIKEDTKFTSTTGEASDHGNTADPPHGTCQTDVCGGLDGSACDSDPGTGLISGNITCTPAANDGGSGSCIDYWNAAQALKHADELHLSSQADGRNAAGVSNWNPALAFVTHLQNEGRFPEYKKHMGYDFVLTSATLPSGNVPKGNAATFKFSVQNKGSANLFNKRTAYLCFEQCATDSACSTETCAALGTDPRRWDAQTGLPTDVNESITVPSGLANGTWDVDLWLPDGSDNMQQPDTTLANQRAYSIMPQVSIACPSGENPCTTAPSDDFVPNDVVNGWSKLGTITVSGNVPPICVTNADCKETVDNLCTTDICVGGTLCTHTNNTIACDDGLFCTLTDVCNGAGSCGGSGAKCSGATPLCNETTNVCEPVIVGGDVDLWHSMSLVFTDSVESYTDTGSLNVFKDRRIVSTFTGPPGKCTVASDCNGAATSCSPTGQCAYIRDGYWNGDNTVVADANGKITTFPANTGSKFVIKWMPLYMGDWSYSVKFCSGTNAFNSNAADCTGFSDVTSRLSEATSGTFMVNTSTEVSTDIRALEKGLVTNRKSANSGEGSNYLSFAGDQPGYFVINGLGVPEGLFNYKGFDNTNWALGCSANNDCNSGLCSSGRCAPSRTCNGGAPVIVKSYANHIADWVTGDPNWVCGTGASANSTGQTQTSCTIADPNNAGKGIIGVINYMASLNANAFYLVINSTPQGDTPSEAPFVDMDNTPTSTRSVYDISKLAQWDIVLNHMNTKGMCPILVLGESETSGEMNDSAKSCTSSTSGVVTATTDCIGNDRRLYAHELMTRFGHHPCLLFSLDEESGFTNPAMASYIQYLKKFDPYDHPVTISGSGSGTAQTDAVYLNASGTPSTALHHAAGSRKSWDDDLDFTGMQMTLATGGYAAYNECIGGGGRTGWRTQSDSDGMRWMCGMLEPQNCNHDTATGTNSLEECREERQWPAMMGGFGLWTNYQRQGSGGSDVHVWDLCVDDFRDNGATKALTWDGIINTFMNRKGRDLSSIVWANTEAYVTDNATSKVYQGAITGSLVLAYQNDKDAITVKSSILTNGQTYTVTWMDPLTGTEYLCNHANCSSNGTITDGGSDIAIGSCSGCTADEALTIELVTTPPTTTTTSTTVIVTTTTVTSTTVPVGTDCGSATAPTCSGDCSSGFACQNQSGVCGCVQVGGGHGAHGFNHRGGNGRGTKAK